MALIVIADTTVTNTPVSGYNVYKIVTASTVDDGDTIDISSILDAANIVSATCQCATDGWLPVAAITTAGVLTMPGSTDNEVRTIHIMGRATSL